MMSSMKLIVLLFVGLATTAQAWPWSCTAADGEAYSQECLDSTQPPVFVKIMQFFKGDSKSCSEYTAMSIDSISRCCDESTLGPDGTCTCPLSMKDSDDPKYIKFTDAMLGDDGWCATVNTACGL